MNDNPMFKRWDELGKMPHGQAVSIHEDRPARVAAVEIDEDNACPQCHYNLRGIDPAYCPECGLFVAAEPVIVFESAEESLTWLAASVMDNHGISNMVVVNESPLQQLVHYGIGQKPACLYVPFKFRGEAIEVLEAEFGKRAFGRGESPELATVEKPDWNCPSCEEENPGAFDVCWSCGFEKPAAT